MPSRTPFPPEHQSHFDNEPFQTAALQEIIDKVAGLIDDLTPREKMVMSLYYGDELNMKEVAEVMGITEGRVSQLHAQAMKRLRMNFNRTIRQSVTPARHQTLPFRKRREMGADIFIPVML